MGSMAGAFVGGLVIGVVESFSGFFLSPVLKEVAYFLVFIMILVLKPSTSWKGDEIRTPDPPE
jgi:branched-chain amino acid transport system permease protein